MGFAHSKAELGLGSWAGHGHLWPFRCPSSLPTAPGPRGCLWPEAPWTQALYKQDGFRRGRKPPLLGPQASPKRLPPGTHRQRGQGVGRQPPSPSPGPQSMHRCRCPSMPLPRAPGPAAQPPCPPLGPTASGACKTQPPRLHLPVPLFPASLAPETTSSEQPSLIAPHQPATAPFRF